MKEIYRVVTTDRLTFTRTVAWETNDMLFAMDGAAELWRDQRNSNVPTITKVEVVCSMVDDNNFTIKDTVIWLGEYR